MVLYAVLPRPLAPLAAVVASLDVYIGYAVGGVTDFLFVPLLIGAAVRLGPVRRRARPGRLAGARLLGLAMAVKQTPWLVAPVRGRGNRAGGPARRDAAGGAPLRPAYAGIATGAFLCRTFRTWPRPGCLAARDPDAVLRPDRPGRPGPDQPQPVAAGGRRIAAAYNVAAIVVFAAILACYVVTYPALKPAAFLLPSVVLFFATRSFGSYLVMLIPAALVGGGDDPAAGRARPAGGTGSGSRSARRARARAAVTVALTAASPLAMAISSVRTTGQLATVEQLTAGRHQQHRQARAARLHHRGRHHHDGLLAAGQRARGARAASAASLTIVAPSYFAMPSITDGFQVLAFCQSPASVSRTRRYVASLWRVVLQPAAVNDPVAVGQLVTVQAEIVNRLDQPMRVARRPGLPRPGDLRAAGPPVQRGHHQPGPAGPDPVEALTNANGVATFRIRSPSGSSNPVYFEANLVKPASFYPYGYSPILSVRFRP